MCPTSKKEQKAILNVSQPASAPSEEYVYWVPNKQRMEERGATNSNGYELRDYYSSSMLSQYQNSLKMFFTDPSGQVVGSEQEEHDVLTGSLGGVNKPS